MEPEAPGTTTRATLADLLDRLLEKGLVIRADLIISVAGIPLIGVCLHAAIAGMETMLEHGMMTDWDAGTRAFEREQRAVAGGSTLRQDEELLLTMPGFCYQREGIYRAWKPGTIYLTNSRLLLHNDASGRTLVDIPLRTVTSLALTSTINPDGTERPVLASVAGAQQPLKLRGRDMRALHRAIVGRLAELGRLVGQNAALAATPEPASTFLEPDEDISHSGKMWFQVNAGGNARPGVLDWFLEDSTGPDTTAWGPGTLYLTNRRLLWTNDFDGQAGFDMPLERIASCAAETRSLSKMLKRKRVVDIVYGTNGSKKVASFAGKEAAEWEKAINCVVGEGAAGGRVLESAGQGRVAAVAALART